MEALGNFFSSFLDKVYVFLSSVLPTSPFRTYLQGYEDGQSGLLSAINYFVPVSTFIAILEVWVTAMFLYFLYHGLLSKIWNAQSVGDRKIRSTFLGNVYSVLKRLFNKL